MTRTSKAVNQQATVTVNGNDVPLFGSLESKALAVVDLDVLKRITSYLPSVPFEKIKENFMIQIDSTSMMKTFLQCLEEELRFHKSVNDIKIFDAEELKNELQSVVVED